MVYRFGLFLTLLSVIIVNDVNSQAGTAVLAGTVTLYPNEKFNGNIFSVTTSFIITLINNDSVCIGNPYSVTLGNDPTSCGNLLGYLNDVMSSFRNPGCVVLCKNKGCSAPCLAFRGDYTNLRELNYGDQITSIRSCSQTDLNNSIRQTQRSKNT